MNKALNLGSKSFVETGKGIGIIAPLSHKRKSEIVSLGYSLGVDFSQTWSCYKGEDLACSVCDSCRIRLEGFREAGRTDPIDYRKVLTGETGYAG